MKIRIKGNSVRLRLTKPEVEKLAVAGYLEERTSFGNNIFTYAVQSKSQGHELSADFDGGKITVFIPEDLLKDWPGNGTVGFSGAVPVSHTETLSLLVEKDFKCLDNTTEDQTDQYENPNKSC